ncbi:MAG: lactate utilization protein [Peptostreptococcaceae bacterium]|nr:lactate utilization protein [Peptostreptococcaceae bacterium]
MRKLRQEVDVSISTVQRDTEKIKKEFYLYKGEALVKSFKKNHFEAYYTDTKAKAAELIHSLIPNDSIIGVGDSHSFYQLNMEHDLKKRGCRLIPNTAALNLHSYNSDEYSYVKAPTREQAREILADYLTSDVFVLSANAITMEGEIVNVDGVGNRIAGSLYGADRIIMVVGINKIVQNETEARSRISNIAAPMNKIKYGEICASVTTGKCTNCLSEQRFCNITTILHKRPIESDYHIVIVGEELGF